MPEYHTEEYINITARAIKDGIHINLIKAALIQEGFTSKKVDVIVRWALQILKKVKDFE